MPGASELVAHVTETGAQGREWIARHNDQIRRLARLKEIVFGTAPDARNALQVVLEGTTVLIDLAGAVDLGKERARLQKEAAGISGELAKIAGKLGNAQFIAKAKPEAVEEQRERQAEAETALARLNAAMARIGAAPG